MVSMGVGKYIHNNNSFYEKFRFLKVINKGRMI